MSFQRWITWAIAASLLGLSAYSQDASVEAEDDFIPREHFQVGEWEDELGYSQAVKVGNVIFVSGMRASGKDMKIQMKTVYMRIQSVLGRFGATMDHVTQERIATTDLQTLKSLAKTRKQFYTKGYYPAVSWVQVEELMDESALVEIEIVAVLD